MNHNRVKLAILGLVHLIFIFLLWSRKLEPTDPSLIFNTVLDAYMIALFIGVVLFLLSVATNFWAFVTTGFMMLVAAKLAYVCTFFYTSILATPAASDKTVERVSFIMQICLYIFLSALLIAWIVFQQEN